MIQSVNWRGARDTVMELAWRRARDAVWEMEGST